VTYGTAFVDTANLTADTVGAITSIHDLQQGGFVQSTVDDLSAGTRNILVGTSKNGSVSDALVMAPDVSLFQRGLVGAISVSLVAS
jgi:hypothetical protein